MKSRKPLLSLSCLLLAFGMVSCTNGEASLSELSFTVTSPQGAPAAALVRYAEEENLVLGQASQVRAAFQSQESDFIIFDSVNGLKLAGENYKLVRMVTFGNLYVVATGNDEDGIMDDDDYIYSYGQGLVPDMAFKLVYPDIVPDAYGDSVSNTAPIMLAGKNKGQDVDYVISSYPPIFAAMNNASAQTELSIYSNVAEEFGKKFGTDGFPQAGLFIKTSLEEDSTKKEAIENFLEQFDADVLDLVEGASNAVELMNLYGDTTAQADRFGFNANVLKGVQKTNGLAFLTADKNPDLEGYEVFKENLGYNVTADQLSSFYPEN